MEWLKERRHQLRINQEDLMARLEAEGFAVSRATISNWETGRHKMPMGDLRFRRALSITLRLPEQEIMRLAGYVGDDKRSQPAERAAHIVDMLPADKQEIALRMLESMIS